MFGEDLQIRNGWEIIANASFAVGQSRVGSQVSQRHNTSFGIFDKQFFVFRTHERKINAYIRNLPAIEQNFKRKLLFFVLDVPKTVKVC
jgi:hypothetical protein